MLNIVKYLRTTQYDEDELRKHLYENGIKTSRNADCMLLSIASGKRNKLGITQQECNGLILDSKSFKPIMIPPKTLRTDINKHIVNAHIAKGNYKIYHAIDGTYFNLYYYNNRWIINTMNGLDMNNVRWDASKPNSKTFQQLITDNLKNASWELWTSGLDINKCYSMIFRHPEIHKFKEGFEMHRMSLHFIQAFNITNYNTMYDEDSELPVDTDSFVLYELPAELSGYVELLKPVKCTDVSTLIKRCKNALSTFQNDKGDVCYGYVLRGNKHTGTHSDLFIESALMNFIKKIWYDNKFNNICVDNKWNKELASLFRVHLEVRYHDTFTSVFPQYEKINMDMTIAVNNIIMKSVEAAATNTPNDSLLEIFNSYTKGLYALPSNDSERIRILREFVYKDAKYDSLISILYEDLLKLLE